jgi:uncharacterized protein involved in exopolysaccharide biosynthesis
VTPAAHAYDPAAAAALIDEICAVLQDAGRAEQRARLTASAQAFDARLDQLRIALDRIEARLAEVEQELALLTRPSWPF